MTGWLKLPQTRADWADSFAKITASLFAGIAACLAFELAFSDAALIFINALFLLILLMVAYSSIGRRAYDIIDLARFISACGFSILFGLLTGIYGNSEVNAAINVVFVSIFVFLVFKKFG